MNTIRMFAVLAALSFLTACLGGGGGGGGGPAVTSDTTQPLGGETQTPGETAQQPEDTQTPDEMTQQPDTETPQVSESDQIKDLLNGLIGSSDTATDASTISGNSFLWRVTVQPTPSSLTLDDMMLRDDGEFRSLGSRRGVSRAIVQDDAVIDFGGWMDYSFFFVSVWNPVGDDPLHPSESTFSSAYSIGEASGSNPVSGGATWSGVMAGIDEREGTATFGNLVQGDAAVTAHFARSAVDVALTDIRDSATGGRHGNISWNGVSLNNGAFSSSDMSGSFYGPNHEEVGGVFLRNQISGAFGALRE